MPSALARLAPSCWPLALLLVPLGCASPGQPKPPSLHIPSPATGLRAQRIGDRVHLTWSTPSDSTDGQGLRGPLSAAICRDPHPPAHPSPDCHRVASLPIAPGPSEADDLLPPPLLTGPPELLLYRVQLFNSAGRAANPSAPAWSAAGAAPSAVGTIHVASTRQGALVTWAPTPDPTPVELRRTLVAAPPRPVTAASSPAPAHPGPRAATRKPQPDTVTLRAEPAGPGAEPAGLRDPGVERLGTYRYTAQRVRTLQLPSPLGGTLTVELRGLPSPPADFTDRDVFPPRPPSGLAAIATPGDPARSPSLAPAIDLSWEPGLEPDLLGYNLYRADAAGAPFRRLNRAPLTAPSFRDLDVQPHRTYLYQVTAVDRTGNESAPSAALPQTVAEP